MAHNLSIVFFGNAQYSLRMLSALKQDGRYNVKLAADGDLTGDVGVVVDYGQLISKVEIDRFPQGIINLHPSLLPRHRGAIPAVSTILEGDKVTGVTIIKINEKYDAGEIVAQEEEPVLPDDTPPVLYDRLYARGISLLLRVLPLYLTGNITLKPQGPAVGPYEKRLTKDAGRINWSQSDEYLERFVRAMHPWPGAWTTLQELHNRQIAGLMNQAPTSRLVKILKARLTNERKLEITELQIEGKKPMGWKEFENGYLKVTSPLL